MQQIHVMIVDDDSEDAEFLVNGFDKQHIETYFIQCATGEEALEWLYKMKALKHIGQVYPDVIFMDIQMPGKSGYQVLKEIKQDKALMDIPVMMISSSPISSEQERCLAAGCAKYFTKPMTIEDYENTAAVTIDFLSDREQKEILSIAV